MSPAPALGLNPARRLPSEPGSRSIARQLYQAVIDAPEAMRRWRAAIVESAGFSKTSGFIDDTRAFCSIPARHDMSRRLEAGSVAQLVAEHRLDEDEALETIHDLVVTNPRKAFKL